MDKHQEYELEEYADISIDEIRRFIDTELQLIKEEHDLYTKLLAISNIVMHLRNLRIIKEEKEVLTKLEEETEHRDWLAVKDNLNLEPQKEKNTLRLEKDELRELHKKFIDLMKFMKRSDLINTIKEDLTKFKEKKEYIKQEEYYFLQIYKFLRAYERIFRHLWKKERRLYNKLN